MEELLSPLTLGALELRNRVVMAPMTRSRAGVDDAPTPLMADYYRQRASAGLIISEGIYPSFDGKGYVRTPGMVTNAQVNGWRVVTDAVHEEGGTIVAQLMHCGRVCAAVNKPDDAETVAPSAIAARGNMYTDVAGMVPFAQPRALTLDEVRAVVAEYGLAARLAMVAGFDGVELHGTSGYLPAQFLSTGSNHRTDTYGGSVENRVRFAREALAAIIAEVGADRTGLRVCPGNPFNDLHDDDVEETFTTLFRALPSKLAYLHVLRRNPASIAPGEVPVDNIALAKEHFSGPLILNDSYSGVEANDAIANGVGDAVSFARHFIGNPDLVERFRTGAELARFNPKAMYTPGPEGYTDYPTAT